MKNRRKILPLIIVIFSFLFSPLSDAIGDDVTRPNLFITHE